MAMTRVGHGGFSLIEVMVLVVLLGVGLGGLAKLVAASLQGVGATRMRFNARTAALSTLEQGGPETGQEGLAVTLQGVGGCLEARVVWPDHGRMRELRLATWGGHACP
jgi:type II secretory pathway pseudopilin PulG